MGCFFKTEAPVIPSWHPRQICVLAGIPADLRTDAQLLGLLVEQQDGHVRQMEIVARDGQDSLQHLVQIKGGEHGLARFI